MGASRTSLPNSSERQQSMLPQNELQRSVAETIAELIETGKSLERQAERLRVIASEYERLLSELRGRSSNERSKADCASIRESDSAKQSSETTKPR